MSSAEETARLYSSEGKEEGHSHTKKKTFKFLDKVIRFIFHK